MISYNQKLKVVILSKFSIVIWLLAYVLPCISTVYWFYILKKCGENRCVRFKVLATLCNFSHEYQTGRLLRILQWWESHYFIDFDY